MVQRLPFPTVYNVPGRAPRSYARTLWAYAYVGSIPTRGGGPVTFLGPEGPCLQAGG